MIPIQCPRCGRTGNVPPDRLNARLVCKGCQSAFHMDKGGRMVLGDPGEAGSAKAKKYRSSAPPVEIDLAQTWRDFPKPAKFGLPTAFVLLAGWMYFPEFSSGTGYQDQAEVVGRALLGGDRAKVVAAATPESAEAAGRWYDLIRPSVMEKAGDAATGDAVHASLLSGNPEREAVVSMGVIVMTGKDSASFTVGMVNGGGQWKLDGAKALEEAERTIVPVKLAKKR